MSFFSRRKKEHAIARTTEKLIGDALDFANAKKNANFIQVRHTDGRRQVIVAMFVHGTGNLWISYNADDLDELIRLLQIAREEMKP